MEEDRKEEERSVSLLSLPDEVILRVLSFFDPRELCVIATLSHWAKRVAEDDCLWRDLFKAFRYKLHFVTDYCVDPVPMQLAKPKPKARETSTHRKIERFKSWKEYYKYRYVIDEKEWSSDLSILIWDSHQAKNYAADSNTGNRDKRKRLTKLHTREGTVAQTASHAQALLSFASRKVVAYVGPRGAGKSTLFYLMKFGKRFTGVRYLRKFGGIVSLDVPQTRSHLELEVWDIATDESLDTNRKIVPFYNLHGVIIIVDSTTIDEHQSAIVKGIILQMLHTPPAIETQDGKFNCNQFVGRELPPVLVFANKCDKPLVPCPSQIAQMLDLPGILGEADRSTHSAGELNKWRVQQCCALDGRGVLPGLEWLHDNMRV